MTRDQMSEKARQYVGSLRRTNQYRKTYWYGVVFNGDKVKGHIPSLNRRYLNDCDMTVTVIVNGAHC